MVEHFFDEHAASIILTFVAITSTIIIAYLFKFKWKPHIERIFEENIDDGLYVIFNQINHFDSTFNSTIKFIENHMGFKITQKLDGLVRDKPKDVINETGRFTTKFYDGNSESMKDFTKWSKIQDDYKNSWIDSLNKKSKYYDDSSSYYQNYIHRLTLNEILSYLRDGISFIQDIDHDYIPWEYIEYRRECAKRIIDFCKKHKIPRKGT